MTEDTRSIIVELLRNIGGRKEVQQYLRQYTGAKDRRFAVLRVGDEAIHQHQAIAGALAFLHQVGLHPVVVHGAPLAEALAAEGFEVRRDGPWMPVSPEALDVLRRAHRDINLTLVDALVEHGVGARPITSNVFTATELDRERYGLVGRVTGVDVTVIEAALRAGQLPIVTSIGEAAGGQLLDVSTDEAACALALKVRPDKLIFLDEAGGWTDGRGRLVSAVNLSEDRARLESAPWLAERNRRRFDHIVTTLEALPPTASVSITAPDHLARELFTHRGAGTLIRRGERVLRHDDFAEVDIARLGELVESCFGRPLVDGYFEGKRCEGLYLTEDYRATAIVTRDDDVPYLDKFAVTQKAQGEGLGGSLWARLRADHPALYWRSRADNPINRWYFDQADGCFKTERWTVFWYGLDDFDVVRRCVERALALPPSLRDRSHGEGAPHNVPGPSIGGRRG